MEQCFLYNECNHIDCDKFCKRQYKLDYLYNQSLLSPSQRCRATLYTDADGTDREAFVQLAGIEQDILNFVRTGKNLFIHSYICGNGKTSWSVRLMQSYFNKIWPKSELRCRGLFINVPRYLLAIKDSISNYNEYADFIRENVLKADLVIWDDIAAKVGTEFELNQLLSVIDSRIAAGKANIFTSNLSELEMENALGTRLASRICGLSTEIKLTGSDKRSLVKSEA